MLGTVIKEGSSNCRSVVQSVLSTLSSVPWQLPRNLYKSVGSVFGASYRQRHTTSSRVTQWRVPIYGGRPIHFATVRSLRDNRDYRATDETLALLGCYAGHVSSYSPTFRDRLSVPSSSSRKSKTPRTSGHVSFINNICVSNCSHSRNHETN